MTDSCITYVETSTAMDTCIHGLLVTLGCNLCAYDHKLNLLQSLLHSQIKELQNEFEGHCVACQSSFDDISDNEISLEKKINNLKNDYKLYSNPLQAQIWQENITKRLEELEKMQKDMISMPNVIWSKYNRTPHTCPKCSGDGANKYLPQCKCHPCQGTGVLWN